MPTALIKPLSGGGARGGVLDAIGVTYLFFGNAP